ncbi:MAG: hypothetical protein ABI702_09190 [Burkholderiales bacterium]
MAREVVRRIIRPLQEQPTNPPQPTSKVLTMSTLIHQTTSPTGARCAASVAFPTAVVAAAIVALCGAALPANAQEVGWHPAVSHHARVDGIDPNTFILGHPASPTTRGGHANHEHPAIIVARLARTPSIDPNTFIVQPPASVTWLPAAEDDGARFAGAAPNAAAQPR